MTMKVMVITGIATLALAVVASITVEYSALSAPTSGDAPLTAVAAASVPDQLAGSTQRPIRIAMSAAFVSEKGIGVYDEMCLYVSRQIGRPCELVTGLSYSTINEMLKTGTVDLAFVCGLPYVLDQEHPTPSMELIAAPVMTASRYQEQPKYYSDLIVRADSPIKTIHDLRGSRFVYNDELSNSGYNMPRFRLVEIGETKHFFREVLRSGSHEESIRMVADGEADASYVDSLVLDYDRTKGIGNADKVKVIESLGPAGICPVVVSRRAPAELQAQLKRALLTMHNNPEGRGILDKALVECFAEVSDDNYDDIRQWKKAAIEAGFPVIK